MKSSFLTIMLITVVGLSLSCSKTSRPEPAADAAKASAVASPTRDPNPQKDPDVQKGYDKHQQEHKDKQKNDNKDNYEVKKSGDTARGASPSP